VDGGGNIVVVTLRENKDIPIKIQRYSPSKPLLNRLPPARVKVVVVTTLQHGHELSSGQTSQPYKPVQKSFSAAASKP
jgi:hypothetical protein